MKNFSKVLDFIKSKSVAIEDLNLGNDQIALSASVALEAVELCLENEVPILGGDILSINSGRLVLAQNYWGAKYHYLNWYSDPLENESNTEYARRSHTIAKRSINRALKVSKQLNKECLVALVL